MILFMIGLIAFAAAVPEEEIQWNIQKGKLLLTCPTKKDEFIAWYKYDTKTNSNVELSFGAKIDFPDINSMAVVKPALTDSGTYTCRDLLLSTDVKKFKIKMVDESLVPTISTQGPSWVFIPQPLSTIDNSRAAILPCRASGKGVKVKAYRLKDSGEVDKELRHSGLILHKPKATDSGRYMCVAKNAGGTLSHAFEIIVRVNGGISEWASWGPCDAECGYGIRSRKRTCTDPSPANGGRDCPESVTERERCRERSCSQPRLNKFGFEITDTELILDCHAKGIPTPKVTWKFDGGSFDSTYDYQNSRFVIPKTRAQSGSYSCTVRNDAGYFTMYISIDL